MTKEELGGMNMSLLGRYIDFDFATNMWSIHNGNYSDIITIPDCFIEDIFELKNRRNGYRYGGRTIYPNSVAEYEDKIEKVVFNPPATIILWKDGFKTVVKCGENEEFDPEKGFAMAFMKKMLGNEGNYYNLVKKYVAGYNAPTLGELIKKQAKGEVRDVKPKETQTEDSKLTHLI